MSRLVEGDPIGRFEVEAFLGEGGIAYVYKVRHRQLGTVHALKLLTVRSPTIAQRLVREGRIQANLRHPSVVSVTDIVEHDGFTGLLMEFVEGQGLDHVLGRHGVLPPDLGLSIFRQVLVGVTAAHDAGVLHRDLKPGNILLEPRAGGAVARVLDFGIAKVAASMDDAHTQQSDLMGTPGYMAPEQADDPSAVDARADVFSLGAVLYCLLAGRPPFAPSSIPALLQAARSGGFMPVLEAAPHVAPDVAAVVERCLEPDPAARFADCRALAEALFPGDSDGFEAEVSGAAPALLRLPGSTPTLTDTAERGRPDTFVLPDAGSGTLRTAVPLDEPEPDPGQGGKWLFIGTAAFVVCMLGWLLFETWSRTGSVVPDPVRAKAVLDARQEEAPPAPTAAIERVPAVEDPVEEGSVDPGLDDPGAGGAPTPIGPIPEMDRASTPRPSKDQEGRASGSGSQASAEGAAVVPETETPPDAASSDQQAETDAVADAAPPPPDLVEEPVPDVPVPEEASDALEETGSAVGPVVAPEAVALDLVGTWTGKLAKRPLTLRIMDSGSGGIRAELDVLQGTTYRTFEMTGPASGAGGRVVLSEGEGQGWKLDGVLQSGIIAGTVVPPGGRKSQPFWVQRQ